MPEPNLPWEIVPIILRRHNITFSKREAAKLVGGTARLLRLITAGKVRVESTMIKQNSRWRCDGGDVLRNIKL